jgi:hypothetical protein
VRSNYYYSIWHVVIEDLVCQFVYETIHMHVACRY